MTKRNPEFGGFSACFAVRAETDRKGKATPPARTETAMCEPVDWIYSDFNPLRPRGRRHLLSGPICVQIQDFNPLRPRGRRLCAVDDWCGIAGISTHSARKDGDERILSFTDTAVIFQPTPPARTETMSLPKPFSQQNYFNPLRPQGRRPCFLGLSSSPSNFNPLRPQGRRLGYSIVPNSMIEISTHSARKDGDTPLLLYGTEAQQFQPTPPARTETCFSDALITAVPISTHSARKDGDLQPGRPLSLVQNISTHSARKDGDCNTTQKTNNSSSHFHNQITSYSLKSPPTYPAHIQNRSHCAVFPVRIPP